MVRATIWQIPTACARRHDDRTSGPGGEGQHNQRLHRRAALGQHQRQGNHWRRFTDRACCYHHRSIRWGNPAGKPPGARHAALVALDAIGAEAGTEIMAAVVAAAKGGDMRAADILLRRLWPERKGRPVQMDLPAIMAPSDIVAALGAVADAVAAGELSPEEGAAVAGILEAQRRAVETVEMEARIARAGAKQGGAAMSGIERRLARLEQAVSPRETVHVWAGAERDGGSAIARDSPRGCRMA